ncbi:hypothetical protein PN36_04230 [Candidatus Thiomargarita nelsonii]|uniref:Uncharacterized protein n=1 Tax=Candidatus Thiomargarita nelsonii TaxID=1003181 RepID=A0A0A6RSK6_9GAMM|nr:hypothetical protein PN36_04230 [Candidatus Thiomargarita nelsonii]
MTIPLELGKNRLHIVAKNSIGETAKDWIVDLIEGENQEGNCWHQSSVVKWRRLQYALENTQERRILLVDTCHSGNAFNSRLVKDAADANIVVISATAQELPALKHGVFTYALLSGLRGYEHFFLLKGVQDLSWTPKDGFFTTF